MERKLISKGDIAILKNSPSGRVIRLNKKDLVTISKRGEVKKSTYNQVTSVEFRG